MGNNFGLVCKLTAEDACKLVDEARDIFIMEDEAEQKCYYITWDRRKK